MIFFGIFYPLAGAPEIVQKLGVGVWVTFLVPFAAALLAAVTFPAKRAQAA